MNMRLPGLAQDLTHHVSRWEVCMEQWHEYSLKIGELLASTEAVIKGSGKVDIDTAFSVWIEWTRSVRSKRATVYFAGNGASASMASHYSADLAKNAKTRTQVFTDVSLITAVGNDVGFSSVFAEPLCWFGSNDDLLITISSSGNSPNVVNALTKSQELDMRSVALCAMDSNNSSRALADLSFYVPASTYGLSESVHAAILHYWLDAVILANS